MAEKFSKQRFIWVDYLKATLIFLMVLGHSSQQGIVGEVLSSFHMPAFFMISGFLYHEREPMKLLRSFIIPFAIFYLLWMIKMQTLNYLMKGRIDSEYLLKTIMGLLSSDMSLLGESSFPGYWFLIVLMLIRMYAGDLSLFRKLKPFQMKISICIVILFSFFFFHFPRQTQFVSNIYVIKAILCFPFFYFGIYIREINSKKIFNLNVLWLLLLLQFSVSLSEINGPTNLMISDFKMGYVPFIINTFPMTFILINIFSKIPPPPPQKIKDRPRLVNRKVLIS